MLLSPARSSTGSSRVFSALAVFELNFEVVFAVGVMRVVLRVSRVFEV
jgi:hypothetical protein